MSDPSDPDWGRVIEDHAERIFRIAFRILGSVHDAEDVSQEVFSEAMVIHQSGEVRTLAGLFVRLATLRAIDRLRKNHRSPEPLTEETSPDEASASPEQNLIAGELASWLRNEIGNLPNQQAAVFSMAYFEQLTRNEISTALDLSPESVSTTLYKARKHLSSRLAVTEGEKS